MQSIDLDSNQNRTKESPQGKPSVKYNAPNCEHTLLSANFSTWPKNIEEKINHMMRYTNTSICYIRLKKFCFSQKKKIESNLRMFSLNSLSTPSTIINLAIIMDAIFFFVCELCLLVKTLFVLSNPDPELGLNTWYDERCIKTRGRLKGNSIKI